MRWVVEERWGDLFVLVDSLVLPIKARRLLSLRYPLYSCCKCAVIGMRPNGMKWELRLILRNAVRCGYRGKHFCVLKNETNGS